jgi:cell division protein FtsQ
VRRRRRRRIGLLAGALIFGIVVGWVLFASPFLSVQQVRLRGLHRVPALEVRAAADPETGRPMALISPQAVAERVVRLPLVLSARVDRSWPMTLVITVVEREPIAAVPSPGAGFDLRDPDGIVVDHVDTVPRGLPVLVVDVDKAGPAGLRAARRVSDALPATLRASVRRISASSEDAVTLTLTDGSTVLWGSAQDSAGKVTALLAVHPKPVSHRITIDVSAPDAPAVTSS